jgi:hypothetical protein
MKILRRLVREDTNTCPSPKRQKLQENKKFPDVDLFLTFMLEQGCLTYANSASDTKGTLGRKGELH